MRILVVNPPRIDAKLYTLRDEICFQNVKYKPFPIRLAQLAGVLQREHDVAAVDATGESLSWQELAARMEQAGRPDAVVLQSAPGLIKHDTRVADLAKEKLGPHVLTILIESGVSPIYPDRFLGDFPAVDVLVRGQPEAVVPEALRHVDDLASVAGVACREGEDVLVNPPAQPMKDMDALPFMAYDLFDPREYTIGYLDAPMHEKVVPGIRMRTTRDCPFKCPFCIIGSSTARGYDGRWKAMSVERVLDELRHVVEAYSVRGVFFWDETFTLNQKRAEQICDAMAAAGLGLEWRCLTRIDCVTARLIEKMAGAGCRLIEFGIEAGDPGVRKELHKDFTDEEAIEVVRVAKRNGVRVNCDMIVGMPWETRATLDATVSLAKRMAADNLHLTMAFPYPETEFHRIATAEGLIEVDDLYGLMVEERVRVGAKPVCRTRDLSCAELEAAWTDVRRRIDRYYVRHNVIMRPWQFLRPLRDAFARGEGWKAIGKGIKLIRGRL